VPLFLTDETEQDSLTQLHY